MKDLDILSQLKLLTKRLNKLGFPISSKIISELVNKIKNKNKCNKCNFNNICKIDESLHLFCMNKPKVNNMKHIIIESIDMVKCLMNKEYVLLSNCCYCNLNELDTNNENYIYCNYKP